MKMKYWIFILAVLMSVYSLAVALPPGMTAKPAGPAGAMTLDTETMIDVNNLMMFVNNGGGYAEDWALLLETLKNDGLYFPSGTDRSIIYSGGIWVGGKVNGEIRLAVGAYDTPEYVQGPADANGNAVPDDPRFKVYKIRGDSTVWHNPDKGGMNIAGGIPYTRHDSTLHYNDWVEWQDPAVLADGAPLDEFDNPLLIGDQTLWCVFNDGFEHEYDAYGGGTESLGVELQSTFWGFDLGGALGNTIFAKWVIINKGSNVIDSAFVSLWADPDLGGASDDYVGCDTTRSIGYCYNATNNDEAYGAAPPAVGFDFLQGPIIRESDNDPIYAGYDFSADTAFLNTGDTIPQAFILPMTSFNKYINGTDPDLPDQAYGYMLGFDAVSQCPDCPYIDPESGDPTKFFGAGDPVAGTGWNDDTPADRRFMLSTGPWTFNPGDTQVVVAAIVVGQGKDRLSSISAMKFYDELAQYAYNVNFDIPPPPPRPIVTARAYDSKVSLTWTKRSEEEYDVPTHEFEGYVVYQGETAAGPWEVVTTFDLKNQEGMLKDFVLNPDLGDVIYQPVVYGLDIGIDYGIEIEEDAINGGPLKNGTTYYFAVTAYSYDYADAGLYRADASTPEEDFIIPKGLWFLENRIQVIRLTPQDDNVGSDWSSALAPVVQSRIDVGLPPSTDVIEPIIIDPEKVNGHEYEIRFRDIYPDTAIDLTVDPPETTIVTAQDSVLFIEDGEPTWAYQYWELWDVTDDRLILPFQTNKSGDGNYEVIDGIQFKVNGAHVPNFQSVNYLNNNTAHDRGLSWVNWGAGYFGGSADYGWNFWGGYLDPAMTDSFTTLELRFVQEIPLTGLPIGQRAYSYLRGGTPNYGYNGYWQCPFEAWDATNDRQVNVTFVEWVDSDVFDSTWNPDATDIGGREYVLLLKSDYDGDDPADAGTGAIDYTTEDFYDGSTFDFMYAGWFRQRGSSGVIDSGDVLQFLWANPSDDNDVFTIQTSAAITGSASLGESALDNIRVVPNPYYAYSAYETDQFDRQVRFLGVPEEFTIRIFNIAGDMVATLESSDLTVKQVNQSWAKWNLATDQGLPAAAGIYIWYLESGYGTAYGKMAIFPEVEQLDTY